MSDLTLAQIPLVTHLLWDLGPLLRQPVPLFPLLSNGDGDGLATP